MGNINLSGVKRITINDDPKRVIEFNPSDVLFIERFYAMYREFEAKQAEYEQRSKELDTVALDENGAPVNMAEGIEFLKDICGFMREKIDILFGEGTSKKAFGDTLSLDMIGQFFEGITPFVWEERTDKVKKYTNTATSKKRTMK